MPQLKASWLVFAFLSGSYFSSPVFAAEKAKEFLLVAKESAWEILPGVKVNAMMFNGTIPGPEIRVQEGDLVRIKVRNELKEPTAVHWHGLDVPYKMDGIPGVTQAPILPGEEFTYEFVANDASARSSVQDSREGRQCGA